MPHHWRPITHERNSIFKCKQHTCTLHDPWGPEKTLQPRSLECWCYLLGLQRYHFVVHKIFNNKKRSAIEHGSDQCKECFTLILRAISSVRARLRVQSRYNLRTKATDLRDQIRIHKLTNIEVCLQKMSWMLLLKNAAKKPQLLQRKTLSPLMTW